MIRKPTQQRALATYERLLDAAGELLAEVGVERISTNLVAARAGVSPPTLYHYFADKYALLAALGERLMAAQNALVGLGAAADEAEIAEVLLAHVALTEACPGGPWIMRMLRAVPQLAEVRLSSHRALTAELVARSLAADPAQDHSALERRARLAVDLGYCAIELVFDEPEFDARAVMQDAARAIAAVLAGS
ncbi:MAG: TetR/AcrR family transcriptional regulator [Sphingomonadaceae bacterium]|nr:TetR/AcrR family transcriptional regulator [Sphingomonadaceae bacterium]